MKRRFPAVAGFLIPAMALFVLFLLYPVVKTFWNSFYKVGPFRANFLGWGNYLEVLQDKTFWLAARHSGTWAVLSIVLEIGIAFLLSLALFNRIWLHRFFRTAWFTPVLIPYVVTGIIWLWIYNYDWGPLNTLLRALGLGSLAKPWLGSPHLALYCLIVASTWMWTGFNMVVLLTAMHSLPAEIFEAAEIDGASPFQKTVKIMVPLLRPTFSSLVVLCFVGKMRIFDLVWVTTGGGPLWATETVATYIYKRAFAWNVYDLGYPSALAVIWFIITFTMSLFLGKVIRGKEVEYW